MKPYTIKDFETYVDGKLGSFSDGDYDEDSMDWILSDLADQANCYGLSGEAVENLISEACQVMYDIIYSYA